MNNKKWIKVILAIMLIALMVSLAACDPKTPPAPGPSDPDEVEEASLTEELVEIIKSIGPLVDTINGVTKDSTLSVDAAIGVDFNFGSGGEYAIGAKGNISKADPQVELTVQDKKNTSDPNWILLSYLNKKAYLKQPLTAVNTDTKTGTTKIDLDVFEADIGLIMEVVMLKLEEMTIPLDTAKLAVSLESLFKTFPIDLSEFIKVTKSAGVTRLVINSGAAKAIVGLLPTFLSENIISIADSVINALMDSDGDGFDYLTSERFVFPTIALEIGTNAGAVNKITFGIDYTGVEKAGDNAGKYAKLVINLAKLSTDSKVAISAPAYKTNSFNINLGASATQKKVNADLDLYVTGDMSNKANKLINGILTVNNKNKAENGTGTAKGYYNGQSVFFDIGSAFAAVDGTVTNPIYQIKGDMYTAIHNAIVDWNAAAKAPKTDTEPEPEKTDEAGPSIMKQIYSWLGGKEKIGKDDPTAKQMLVAVDALIGDYIRIDIKKDSYEAALTAIVDAWNENKDTVKKIIAEDKKWAEVAEDSAWVGNLYLRKDGTDNDLLDAINLFFCNGKDAEKKPIDITVDFLTDIANKYLALIARSNSNLLGADALLYKAAVEELDNRLLYAKNVYLRDINAQGATEAAKTAAKEAYDAAKDAHYKALKFEDGIGVNANLTANYFANLVMKEFFGYEGTSDDYLADFINSGVTVKVECKKGQGLNGAIAIFGNTNETELEYVRINGYLAIVGKYDPDLTDFDTEGALELTDKEVGSTDEYKVINTWDDGTKKLVLAQSGEIVDGKIVIVYDYSTEYKDRYANLETLQGDLWNLLENYKAITPAA